MGYDEYKGYNIILICGECKKEYKDYNSDYFEVCQQCGEYLNEREV